MSTRAWRVWALAWVLILSTAGAAAKNASPCDPGNGGITLPDGFCASVFADTGSYPRHIWAAPGGVVYANLADTLDGGSILALKDNDGDGRADDRAVFGDHPGNSIAVHKGYLYASMISKIVRYPIEPAKLLPTGKAEIIVTGFPPARAHGAKTFAIDPRSGDMFINLGAPSNACQIQPRTPGSKGKDPCPERDTHASVWRFSAEKTDQRFPDDGEQYARGSRNLVAISWNQAANGLYAVQHGRDQLHDLWPELFDEKTSAELPAEEFWRISRGDDFGWPYCYYDHRQGKRVLAPEYGGDGVAVGRCEKFTPPLMGFPGHYAPNGLAFYDKTSFPARYHHGAFIAFHGSWNRMPFTQRGFLVAFVPMADGAPASGEWEIFANGFAGKETFIGHPSEADHRPMGLSVAEDGALYIGDDKGGRIWRVIYAGE